MKTRFVLLIIAVLLSRTPSAGQSKDNMSDPVWTNQERYIREHAGLAVKEMYLSGIPASIKLAQGLLETASGTSRLATEGNNHFGIKCKSSWIGDTLLVVDDDFGPDGRLMESCFRRYAGVTDSYRDHSDFLLTSPRYQELFQLDRTDYRGWANGLQRCGYATNPQYAEKISGLVERYQLHVFDRVPEEDLTACLDYYDTQLYVMRHQENTGATLAANAPPASVRLPDNYKGGWLRENTRIRMITTLLDRGGAGATRETVQVRNEGGFLSFEVAARPQ